MRAAAMTLLTTASTAPSTRRMAVPFDTFDRRRRRERRRRNVPLLPPPRPRPLPTKAAAAASSSSSAETATTTTSGLGRLTIRPLLSEDVGAACVVLTRAFASGGTSPPLSDVEEWLRGSLEGPESSPETVVLVAELVPDDERLLPPGKRYRVAGVASVARTTAAVAAAVGGGGEDGRDPAPLLCNVAVDPRLKRKGIGSALVEAAEGVVGGSGELFVVARGGGDEAAEKLYLSRGFVVVDERGASPGGGFGLSSLFGGARKKGADKLMRKRL